MAVKFLCKALKTSHCAEQKNKEVPTTSFKTQQMKVPQIFMKIPHSAYHFRENLRPVGPENSVVPPRYC